MLYDYKCNNCEHRYERSNTIEHRSKGGRCPECTSKDTVKVMSTPMFRTCGTGHGEGPSFKGEWK